MSHLELKNLSHRFGEKTALENLNLSVGKGELVSLLGPSGCGKTTTIRLIAGFLSPAQGSVWIGGRDVTALPPERRSIGMVFQSYALFPHLDVFENIAFGLRATKVARELIGERAQRVLSLVNLPGYQKRPVFELSGGEQQRVAIARAVVVEPQILLLDEPLSNLDAALRERTRQQLRELISSLGITTIFVTHDQEEAFALSDRIVLLSEGRRQQVGTARELYDSPANIFVAGFIGKSNIFEMRFKGFGEDCFIFVFPSGRELRVRRSAGHKLEVGQSRRLLLRPEKIEFEMRSGHVPLLSAKVVNQRFAGAWSECELEGEGMRFLAIQANRSGIVVPQAGSVVDVYVAPEAIQVL